MDPDSLIRISELIHAIKVFIATANRLKDEDMKHLEKIAEMLEEENGGRPKVNKAQFEKAEPIMREIELLNKKKDFISGFPSECYRVEFKLASGNGVVARIDEFGTESISRLINEFKSSIDERIRILEKKMEEI